MKYEPSTPNHVITPFFRTVHSKLRDFFDLRLEHVLSQLPDDVTALLEAAPLHVEDYPSDEVMAQFGVSDRSALCGLYSGVPMSERSVDHGWRPPDVIKIYREGILRASENENGELTEDELLRQIRITVLHELGHYHGFDETQLDELGYG